MNKADIVQSNSGLAQKHKRQALKADFIQDIQRAKPSSSSAVVRKQLCKISNLAGDAICYKDALS